MGDLTRYIGGQIVTDSGGIGERNFIIDLDGSETRVAGNIYFTASEIQNAVSISEFNLITTSIPFGTTSATFNITAEDDAEFTIVNTTDNITSRNFVVNGTDVTSGTNFTVNNITGTNTGADTRDISFTIVPNSSSDPETILADGTIATRGLQQTAQPDVLSAVTLSGVPGSNGAAGPWYTYAGTRSYPSVNISTSNNISFINNTGQTVTFSTFGNNPPTINLNSLQLRFWLGRGDTAAVNGATFANGYNNDEGGFSIQFNRTAGAISAGRMEVGFTMSAPGYRSSRIIIYRLDLT